MDQQESWVVCNAVGAEAEEDRQQQRLSGISESEADVDLARTRKVQTGWKPNPHTYRKAVGTAEVVCGAVLAFVPGALKEVSNVALLGIMLNDIYAHYSLDEGLEKMSPSIVFALLLTCRIVIFLQALAAEPKSVFDKKQRLDTSPMDNKVEEKKEQ
ncbi:hypothetical protein BaRGS_00028061 [Batillaria attramentaria]|uniref:Novel acetylcholine receptor chaperone n=1 Tax=Batillaria attramentaria TaxID=370345 RepID=A0ABD0K0K8_9CAEN